jgi:phenylacetate-CoA ligase
LHGAYGRVELLPSADDPILGGRRYVRIISTGFWNSAMPLIRYDTGDRAIVPAEANERDLEAISLGLLPFFGISGRDDDYILAPTGLKIGEVGVISRK